jgi:hypothetical protein
MCGTVKRTSKNKTGMGTQMKFYIVTAVCAGLYGIENWILMEKYENRIQTAEMRFLTSTLGVTRQGRLTNEAHGKTLKLIGLNDAISKYRDCWFNRLMCVDQSFSTIHIIV